MTMEWRFSYALPYFLKDRFDLNRLDTYLDYDHNLYGGGGGGALA